MSKQVRIEYGIIDRTAFVMFAYSGEIHYLINMEWGDLLQGQDDGHCIVYSPETCKEEIFCFKRRKVKKLFSKNINSARKFYRILKEKGWKENLTYDDGV